MKVALLNFAKTLLKYLGLPIAEFIWDKIKNEIMIIVDKDKQKKRKETVGKLNEARKTGKKGDISRNLHDL